MRTMRAWQCRCAWLVLTALLIGGESAVADTVTVVSSKDNTLYQEPGLSNGRGQHFFVGRNSNGQLRRGLVAFDLSAIPARSTVLRVSLVLNMSMNSSPDVSVELHRLVSDWGEGTSVA